VIDKAPSSSPKEKSLSRAPYQIYNIGSNSPINLLEFIEVIEDKLGMKAEKIMMPMQDGDVYTTYADVTQLRDDLGYQPNSDLKKSIGSFIEWYNDFYRK
jgi:UDP-glucuronate 4-epimerase